MNDTLEHVARAIFQRRRDRSVADKEWAEALAQHDAFHAEFAVDGRCGTLVCDVILDARAAIRALLEREPSERMVAAASDTETLSSTLEFTEPHYGKAWRAMLAAVLEGERDATL